MVGIPGVSGRLFTALAREKINVILISQASSEHSICIAINANESLKAKQVIEEEFKLEINNGQIDEVTIHSDLCIVAIVGENMKRLPGTASKMFASLGKNGVNILAIAQGSSEKNISAVVAGKDQKKALNALHEAFFLSDKKVLNLFILGPGVVGGKLLDIIEKQRKHLSEHHLIDLKVLAIANSTKMYFDENGNAHVHWKHKLDTEGKPMHLMQFVNTMRQYNLPNSVFVDATASDAPVAFYDTILASSISIVTPNKRACSGKLAYYQKLKKLSVRANARFLYETNVGAGLPVINTLNDLLMSGDEVLKIEAVVSGTLNYLFYHFDENMSFTDLLMKAKELGYTEPDPRDDLSGMDVARKILILARECGSEIELKNVSVENLVPVSCRKTKTLDEFFIKLKKTESIFTERLLNARKKGCKLKYVATYENGTAQTALREIDESHPFYTLAGTENCFCFTTQRYKQYPLVVKGPGAGADVTAAGVFADIIKIANY
jgi:aspartokinase/homoserine dehydrogenase 1